MSLAYSEDTPEIPSFRSGHTAEKRSSVNRIDKALKVIISNGLRRPMHPRLAEKRKVKSIRYLKGVPSSRMLDQLVRIQPVATSSLQSHFSPEELGEGLEALSILLPFYFILQEGKAVKRAISAYQAMRKELEPSLLRLRAEEHLFAHYEYQVERLIIEVRKYMAAITRSTYSEQSALRVARIREQCRLALRDTALAFQAFDTLDENLKGYSSLMICCEERLRSYFKEVSAFEGTLALRSATTQFTAKKMLEQMGSRPELFEKQLKGLLEADLSDEQKRVVQLLESLFSQVIPEELEAHERVHEKVIALKDKFEKGQPIYELEKLSPKESELIDTFQRLGPMLDFLLFLGVKIPYLDSLQIECEEIGKFFMQAIPFNYENTSLIAAPFYIGSVYTEETGLPYVSHLVKRYERLSLDGVKGLQAKVNCYSVNKEVLLTPEALELLRNKYPTFWRERLEHWWEEIARGYYEERNFEHLTERYKWITAPGALAHHRLFGREDFGSWILFPEDHREMTNSEFVLVSLIISINRLNERLTEDLNLPLGSYCVRLPIDANEKLASYWSDELIPMLEERGFIKKIPPHPNVERLFSAP